MNHKKFVLLVDDEAILLLSVQRELMLKLGSEITCLTSLRAEDGLKKIDELAEREENLSLVISDWLMPGMNGDVFLREVRKRYPKVRLVLLSGHVDDEQVTSISHDIDLFAFLKKPCRRNEIYDTVKQAIEQT